MSFQQTPTDVSVIVSVATTKTEGSLASERRITPSWSISVLKTKLETMTGIPPGCQKLRLKVPGREDQWVEGEERIIGDWGLCKGSEIEIHDTRPPGARPDFGDLSSVEKYTLPAETYETMPGTVLSWKKNQKLGRFDPDAASPEEMLKEQVEKEKAEIEKRGIQLGKRAVVEPSTHRRGTVRFVGVVPTIPSPYENKKKAPSSEEQQQQDDGAEKLAPLWVGIELDEPTGKNDGSVGGQRFFTAPNNTGVFVKPEKVRVGDYPPLGLEDELDEDMEEI